MSAQPNNVGFELGDFTGWTGRTGSCCPINVPTVGIVAGRHEITSGGGFDAVVPSVPVVSPYGGTFSCKLGNELVGAQAERLIYTFTVDAANPVFTYHYAVLLEDNGHNASQQPRFQINIMDASGNTIPCGAYNVVAGSNIPGFQTYRHASYEPIRYKNWSLVAINLEDYIGQTITAQFQTGDCSQSGHFGYAYIDANVGPLRISGNFCPGDPQATLTAPPGFLSYLWSTGQTAQTIVVNNPTEGDTITVVCTPFQGGANCTTTLFYAFERSPDVDVDFTFSAPCGNEMVHFIDASTINGGDVDEWTWWVNGVYAGSDSTLDYSFPSPGNYEISLTTNSAVGCPDTIVRNVIVPSGIEGIAGTPTAGVYNGYGVSCPGASDGYIVVNINNGNPPYTYTWNVPNQNSDSIYGLPPGEYIVDIVDSEGCQTSDTAVLIPPPPLQIAPIVQDAVCYDGNQGKIFLNAFGGVSTLPYTYTWAHNPSLNADSATFLYAGVYSFTITDANGCTFDSSIAVSQPIQYDITHTYTDAICFGSSTGSITITGISGNTPPYTYQWSTSPADIMASVSGLPIDNYNCTVTDANGCTAVVSQVISQPPLLTVGLPKTNVRCFGDSSGSITAVPQGGVGGYTYSWSTGSIDGSIPNIPIGSYTVTVTDANGCTTEATTVITEPSVLEVSISSYDTKCYNDSSARAFSVVTGGTAPYNYVWSSSPLQTQPNAVNLRAGTYIITVTDINACTATASTVINQPPRLSVHITDTVHNICYDGRIGEATAVASGGSPGYRYVWNSVPLQYTVTAVQLGASQYTVTVTDDSACIASASVIIRQPTRLTATNLVNNALCFDSAQGSVKVFATGGTPQYTYAWNPDISTSDSVINVLRGDYSVTITDANGCTLSQTYSVGQPPRLYITAQGFDLSCYGANDGSVSIRANGGTPVYTYSLLRNNAVVATSSTGSFTGLREGSYLAQYADANGCIINQPVTVGQPSEIIIESIVADSVNCFGYSDGSISLLASGGTAPYRYILDTISENSWGLFNNLPQGFYRIRVYDSKGCFIDTSAVLYEPPYVTLYASPDSLVLDLGETKTIELSSNNSAIQYQWFPPEGLSCTTCDKVAVTTSSDLYYQVQGVTHPHDLDCIVEILIPVTVAPQYRVYVPNAFTPNTNGANDYYEIFGDKSTWLQMRFRIFNRWGEKVFEAADPYFKWDGTYKGVPVQANVYVYEMELTFMDGHTNPLQKGSITLIR